MMDKNTIKGRAAQYNPHNKFKLQSYDQFHIEGIDCFEEDNNKTIFIPSIAKTLVHKVDSPDVGMTYSANPYQGCEHGCIYCYARNSHQYWDFSSGLDFEKKIIIKENAVELFSQFIRKPKWDHTPIHLSGNTDCYQPAERKFKITRRILKTALHYNQPINIISKNSLILRDIDILEEMAKRDLIRVVISITSLQEETRIKLEPRTVTAQQRLKVVEQLAKRQIPVGVNVAPIIPGLTDFEIPAILKMAASAGAQWANYIIVRLNGQIGEVFKDWLQVNYPDRQNKIWNAIQSCHNGQVNNSNFGERMTGSGKIAAIIHDVFKLHCSKNKLETKSKDFNRIRQHNPKITQLKLF